jgi:hypothetical protein
MLLPIHGSDSRQRAAFAGMTCVLRRGCCSASASCVLNSDEINNSGAQLLKTVYKSVSVMRLRACAWLCTAAAGSTSSIVAAPITAAAHI